jgi:glyoxylase I family protein
MTRAHAPPNPRRPFPRALSPPASPPAPSPPPAPGLEVNPDRPHHKLPYRGAWLWIGPEMIHLMELPNPDPADAGARPPHGGRDRHFCIGVAAIGPIVAKLEAAGVPYTRSASGRPAVFFRDPDASTIECVELERWR